jgi:general secretion pathway protein K
MRCPIINKRCARRVQTDERGIALLLTLLVTIILAVVVLEFNYLMRVHATLSGNLVDDLRAQAGARAGIEAAKALLLNDALADSKKGLTFDGLDEEWASEIKMETPPVTASAIVTDEMSKLNLNRLIKRPATEEGMESVNPTMVENVKHLFELLELDPNLVDCIVDWIDENDLEEPFGAESAYYESLTPPVKCKNGPLDSVEELLLVKGFDAKILYGDEDKPGLAEFVTVFGDKKGLVNINTSPEKVIAAVLNSESLASQIVDARQTMPFENAANIAARIPDANLSGKFTTGSSYFMVVSTGKIGGADPSVKKSDSADSEEKPTREVKIRALLKRVQAEQEQTLNKSLTIETAYWKMER